MVDFARASVVVQLGTRRLEARIIYAGLCCSKPP